jgi:hypothetical protein
MERYMFPLRILITLLILTMLLPGWGPLSISIVPEPGPAMSADAIGVVSPFDR